MSFDLININDYLPSEPEDEKNLYDYTEEFINCFKELANKEGFGGIFWIIGTFGAGKSALLCTLCDFFLKYGYEKRNVAFYQAPKKLLKAIQKAVPGKIKHKFRIIETLSEVKSYDILCIDEGYLSADAKNSLTKDSRNFIASLTTLRHSSVFTILNSPDDGILRGYRIKAQFRLYKLLPDGYIDEVNDRFAKRYGELITNLREKETVFQITHIDFLKKGVRKGFFILPLKEYCPWYNDRISRHFEGEDFDAYMRKLRKKKARMEAVIQLLINKFGEDLNRKRAEGFLFDEYIEIFKEFESDIGNIVKVALYRMYEGQFNQPKIIVEKNEKSQLRQFIDIYDPNNFIYDFNYIENDQLLHNLMRKENKKKAKKFDIEKLIGIYELRKAGVSDKDVMIQCSYKYQSGVSNSMNRYNGFKSFIKGYYFEVIYEKHLKKKLEPLGWYVKRIGTSGKADIIAQKDDVMLVFSLKNEQKITYNYDDLHGEMKFINENLSSYPKTHLYLVVFNRKNNKIIIKKLNYLNFEKNTVNF